MEQPYHGPEDRRGISAHGLKSLLFRIVRELLFNVAKHADTNRATVKLRKIDGYIQIRIEDEGKGFDVEATEASHERGLGLCSVRERLRQFGGNMEIESVPGEGTRVTIDLPLALR